MWRILGVRESAILDRGVLSSSFLLSTVLDDVLHRGVGDIVFRVINWAASRADDVADAPAPVHRAAAAAVHMIVEARVKKIQDIGYIRGAGKLFIESARQSSRGQGPRAVTVPYTAPWRRRLCPFSDGAKRSGWTRP